MHNIQPLLNKNYPKAVSASGVYIYDEQGRPFLDGSSGAITCSLGHSHPAVIEKMKENLSGLQYVYRSQFGSFQAEALAEKLCRLSPQGHYQHSFFVNSGSEAIETAMKIALQYWQELGQPGKTLFVTRRKSYHGITQGALSISGHLLRRKIFEKTLDQHLVLKADLECDDLDTQLHEFQAVIEAAGSGNIAAFVAEPVIGAAGTALTPPEGYYQAFKKVCREHDILFIADEVMTGLGRTGSWFGLDQWHTVADIATIGKSLGAGYAPIAATLISADVLNPIKNGSGLIMSGHTYSGHPYSCATACQILDTIEEDALVERVIESGQYLMQHLQEIRHKYGFIETVRGKGLLLGMEFDPQEKDLQKKIIDTCFSHGLLVYPSVGGPEGVDENGILIAPPFIISREEMNELIQKLEESLADVFAKI